jgi:hypothetical protein
MWIVSLLAALALMISLSSSEAATPKSSGLAKSSVSQPGPKKHSYSKGLRARSSAGCKMSGSR